MAFRLKRLLHTVIATLLVVAMLPVASANAAPSYFIFPSYGSTPAQAKNSPVNSPVIEKFYGTFSQDVPSTLSYTVQQMFQNQGGEWVGNGIVNTVPNATPVIFGPTSQEFYIQNINLFNGMNMITISSGNVEGTAYVYYDNVPYITSVTLNNGAELNAGGLTYVDIGTQFFLIKAANASSVSVNAVNATKYGPDAFSVSNFALQPGLNTLTFVAKSDTREYSITRKIVYLSGPGSTYNVFAQSDESNSDDDAVQLDDGKVVSSLTALPEGLKGQIAFPGNSTSVKFTKVILSRDTVPLHEEPITDPDSRVSLTGPVNDGAGHDIYTFFIDLNGLAATGWPISTNGTYQITLQGTYFDGTTTRTYSSPIAFVYKDASKASIKNVQQMFGVDPAHEDESGTAGIFSSAISDLPIYALVSVQNNAGDFTANLTVSKGSDSVVLTEGTEYEVINLDISPNNGKKLVKIVSLPYQGDITFTFSIVDDLKTDTYPPINVRYNPVPSIVVYGIYDGDNYTNANLPDFSGKLFNFVTNADKQNIQVTVNGAPLHAIIDTGTSEFKVINGDPDNVNQLQNVLKVGPNEVKISGTTQGIPVVTRLTVYFYSDDAPIVASPVPVPVVSLPPRNIEDTEKKFVKDESSQSTYQTNERLADILFSAQNAEKLVVMKDGKQYFAIDFDTTGNPTTPLPFVVDGVTVEQEILLPGTLRIKDLPLNMGSNSFVFRGIKDAVSSFVPMTIVRTAAPFQLLSPKLPEERVVNQNFLKIVISAEGADSVLLGKVAMDKIQQNGVDYFVGYVDDLKVGTNKIKYTVMTGSQKSDNQFEVVYANANTPGAQFRTSLAKSGKITAFNKEVSLTFPKGTMLTPYNDTSLKINLFDNQKLLLGIADPTDGRTIRQFNHFGDLIDINSSSGGILSTVLMIPDHFGYGSPLYWVDAGYYDNTQAAYKQRDGMHPYYGNELNYSNPTPQYFNVWDRNDGSMWMKTTERGTITLNYDESIRNTAANRLSIWRFGFDGNMFRWINLGGKVNASAHTVTANTDSFGYYAVFYNTFGFDDTQGHDFARDDMEIMFARGIMNAKSNSDFGAYEPTTRGEFATIMVKVLDLPLSDDPNNILFFDIPRSIYASPYWDYRYIETAGQKGIVRGIGPRQFAPDDPVTRQEAAVMIANAMNLKLSTDIDKSRANVAKTFTDSGKMGTYSYAAIEAVYKAKLMNGRTVANSDPNGKPLLIFDPTSNITRAETAKVVANIMRAKKLL